MMELDSGNQEEHGASAGYQEHNGIQDQREVQKLKRRNVLSSKDKDQNADGQDKQEKWMSM